MIAINTTSANGRLLLLKESQLRAWRCETVMKHHFRSEKEPVLYIEPSPIALLTRSKLGLLR